MSESPAKPGHAKGARNSLAAAIQGETVEAFDVIGEKVSPQHVKQSVCVSSDFGQHAEWLHEYVDQGWDELYLHFVGKEQSGFIEAFGDHVLPQLSPTAPRAAIA